MPTYIIEAATESGWRQICTATTPDSALKISARHRGSRVRNANETSGPVPKRRLPPGRDETMVKLARERQFRYEKDGAPAPRLRRKASLQEMQGGKWVETGTALGEAEAATMVARIPRFKECRVVLSEGVHGDGSPWKVVKVVPAAWERRLAELQSKRGKPCFIKY